jgi:hypothetical protein
MVRLDLYNHGLFCGAQAIRWELEDLGVSPLPSLRTINRILSRYELTHRRTGRYEPTGRKYPALEGHLCQAKNRGHVFTLDFFHFFSILEKHGKSPCFQTPERA